MMASNIPLTPSVKRSFSLPPQMPKTASSPDPQIEILYNLPSVRIIQFNAGKAASTAISSRPSSSNGRPVVEPELPGTLSWVSRIERTIAVGALRIYRAPGSVAFLNCQNALRPILPKSQAWCVDGDSKFVLQIRPPQYWRIEVPNETKEEKAGVQELKEVLDQVLRFEKTPCPFERDFVVELPEAPATPIKKRPWRPRPVARPMNEDSSEDGQSRDSSVSRTPMEVISSEPEQLMVLDCDRPRPSIEKPNVPEIISEIETLAVTRRAIDNTHDSASLQIDEPEAPAQNEEDDTIDEVQQQEAEEDTRSYVQPSLIGQAITDSDSSVISVDSDFNNASVDRRNSTDDVGITPRPHTEPFSQSLTADAGSERPLALRDFTRAATAPPVLSLVTSPPSKHRTKSTSPLRYCTTNESCSDLSSSVESFHSVQSWHSPLAPPSPPSSQPPSPADTHPYPHENILRAKRPPHLRDTSEQTLVPASPRHWDVVSDIASEAPRLSTPPPRTPVPDPIKSDAEPTDISAEIRPAIRHRGTTSSNSRTRALSPLPAAVNLFSPPRNRRRKLQTARHLPTAIIQKTCEILTSPPSYLFSLMIKIASKIAAGEWRGMLSSHGEAVHWDFEDDYGGYSWFEDDYGVGHPNFQVNKGRTSSASVSPLVGESWEVD